jgi:hypothetical protein
MMAEMADEEDFDAFNAREGINDSAPGAGNSGDTRGDEYDSEAGLEEQDNDKDFGEDVSDFDREDASQDDLMGTGLKRAQSAKQI